MRILHIDETFHPNFGYHCAPLSKFHALQGHEVFVIAPEAKYIYPVYHAFGEYGDNINYDDKMFEDSTGVKIIRVCAKGYIANRLIYKYSELLEAIERVNPDVIMVHCVETITAVFVLYMLKNKYPLLFDSHMLSMASTRKYVKVYEKLYKMLVSSLIIKKGYTVITTQDDDYITSHLGIPKQQTKFVSFGTDTDLFCPNESARRKFLFDNDLPEDTFVIVSTGKMSESKNGKLFANVVSKKFNTNRTVVIIVVASFSGEYEKEVETILKDGKNKVIYFPVQQYINLPWFYQIADVVVFASQCSMSFYDAQSCGTPVISEYNNVNIQRNSYNNGFCFLPGDEISFYDTIDKLINMDEVDYLKMRDNSRELIVSQYDYKDIAKVYSDLLFEEYNKFYDSF